MYGITAAHHHTPPALQQNSISTCTCGVKDHNSVIHTQGCELKMTTQFCTLRGVTTSRRRSFSTATKSTSLRRCLLCPTSRRRTRCLAGSPTSRRMWWPFLPARKRLPRTPTSTSPQRRQRRQPRPLKGVLKDCRFSIHLSAWGGICRSCCSAVLRLASVSCRFLD